MWKRDLDRARNVVGSQEKSWTRGHLGAVEDPAPGVGGFSGEEEKEEEVEIKVRRRRRQRPSCSATVRWRPRQVPHPFWSPPILLVRSSPNLSTLRIRRKPLKAVGVAAQPGCSFLTASSISAVYLRGGHCKKRIKEQIFRVTLWHPGN